MWTPMQMNKPPSSISFQMEVTQEQQGAEAVYSGMATTKVLQPAQAACAPAEQLVRPNALVELN